ncbi:MAG: tripartite tricarboxylate transporter permease, partial [Burkholderiales bacterium]
LTRKGHAGRALKMSLYASVFGELVSDIALIALAIPFARVALSFGPVENFALGLFSLTLIAVLSEGNMVKGLLAGAIGMLLATFGLDPLTGDDRLTFGIYELSAGWSFIALVIGVFAIAEALAMVTRGDRPPVAVGRVSMRDPAHRLRPEDWRLSLPHVLRAAPIGVCIGAIPGLGSAISAFLNYGLAKSFSKRPERFGQGAIEGVAVAECGNNAVTGSTFIPLLTLGIPGDVITAIMLGAFMVHGLVPGPQLFRDQADFVAAFLALMLVTTVLHLVIGRLGLTLFAQAIRIPGRILFPIVVVLSATGVYVATNSVFDIWVMLGFGVLGYVMNRCGIPIAPLLIGFILGPIVETGFRQSLIVGRGDWSIFVLQPISAAFLALSVLVLGWSAYREWRGGRGHPQEPEGRR